MIYLPPPQPVINKDIRISGDVEIHPTASLAPGVILQAAPNHRIVIGADVCIGMGVIINAGYGSIEIGSGAILGSGVLIIGACKIGNNACIATAVTIFQTDVEAMKVIEPGSILGDPSRKLDVNQDKQQQRANSSSSAPPSSNRNGVKPGNYYYQPKPKVDRPIKENPPTNNNSASSTEVQPEIKKEKKPVVGQVHINQLLVTLFPHNQDLNSKTKKLE